jgi:protease IV
MPSSRRGAALQTVTQTLRAGARNALRLLPGERPGWVVVDLSGSIAPRPERPRFMGLPIPPPGFRHRASLSEIVSSLDTLSRAAWLTGVLFRIEGLHVDQATAYALRRAIVALGASGKQTVAYLTELGWTAYYVASGAREVVAPESADVGLRGLGLSVTFMRDALAKVGVRFEKLAIDEYKNAFDTLVRQEMSPAQREQLATLLERFEDHYTAAIGASRGMTPDEVRALVDEGISTAERARDAKLIDRVAYEDEIIGPGHRPLGEVGRFLGARVPPLGGGRVALVSLTGAIMSGKSRRLPLPLGNRTAGSETVVAELRTAGSDPSTRAVVLFVDSPGGSALASDLIGREVKRLRDRKPVVAVMGAVAGSGGYYVLTHATRVVAAPTTITGSIGVLTGKIVLEDFFARWGFRAEQIQRGRYALMLDPSRPFGDEERALLRRSNEEVYARFVARVAEGRGLSQDRVREIGRGRLWSGSDALGLGLVDELGDLETGLARARELGGMSENAPVWDVEAGSDPVLPEAPSAAALMEAAAPLLRETSWMILPAWLRVG